MEPKVDTGRAGEETVETPQRMMIEPSLVSKQLKPRREGVRAQADGILNNGELEEDIKRDRILTMISNLVTQAHDSEAAAVAIGYFAHNTALNEIIPLEPYIRTKEVTSGQREQVWEREVEIARQLVKETGLPKDFLEENSVLVPAR